MVAYRHPDIVSVPLTEVIGQAKLVKTDSSLVKTARGIGISFGD